MQTEGRLRRTRCGHESVSARFAGAQPQKLQDVNLGVLEPTYEILPEADPAVSDGEIAVEPQRMFAKAIPCGTRRENRQTIPIATCAGRMIRDEGQGLRQLRLGGRQRRHWIADITKRDFGRVDRAGCAERYGVVRVGGERAIKEGARLCQMLRRRAHYEMRPSLKIEIHRVRGRRSLRMARLSGEKLSLQSVGEPCDDRVLQVEEIGERFVEALGPEMGAALGVDQLHVDAHAGAAALHAAFEHIAHVQFAPDGFRSTALPL